MSRKSYVFLGHECHRTVLTDVVTYLIGKFILVAEKHQVYIGSGAEILGKWTEQKYSASGIEILGESCGDSRR